MGVACPCPCSGAPRALCYMLGALSYLGIQPTRLSRLSGQCDQAFGVPRSLSQERTKAFYVPNSGTESTQTPNGGGGDWLRRCLLLWLQAAVFKHLCVDQLPLN